MNSFDYRSQGKIVASIEARMGSSRLPDKMLLDICGKTTLERVVERLKAVNEISEIVVATTLSDRDDSIERVARELGIACFRGSEQDVLGRVVAAHEGMGTDIIVQVCGDCPLLDPEVVAQSIRRYLANKADFVSNALVQTYPQGTEVSVVSMEKLKSLSLNTVDLAHREHVTLGLIELLPYDSIMSVTAEPALTAPGLRLQLDYAEDLSLIRALFSELEASKGPLFGVKEILNLIRLRPDIAELNSRCKEAPVR
ncbi:cytidylyltransferase domain-containing protein [Flagellimonas sp.]|uniref:cytidylyltransferase domain-containing protein n=1 Tax=Flagellimonas sp. TaxID=2058762 RepID=UPI003AB54919